MRDAEAGQVSVLPLQLRVGIGRLRRLAVKRTRRFPYDAQHLSLKIAALVESELREIVVREFACTVTAVP